MRQPERQEFDAKSRLDGPTPLTQEQDTFPTCGTGCSCGAPAKNSTWKIVIMLIVIAVAVISMIYKELI